MSSTEQVIQKDIQTRLLGSVTDVHFPSIDPTITLAGWWVTHPQSSKVAILVHGHNDSKADYRVVAAANIFFQLGYNVLLFDIQNHGLSTRIYNQTSLGSREYKDVVAAKNYVKQLGFEPTKIVYWGLSFGGSLCAIAAQFDATIQTVIMDSSFSSVDAIMQEEFQLNSVPMFFLPGALAVARYVFQNPIGRLTPFHIHRTTIQRLLLLHSETDQRVRVQHSKTLYQFAEDKNIAAELYVFKTGGHGEAVLNKKQYKEILKGFLQK